MGHKQEISVSFQNVDQLQAGVSKAWEFKCPCLPDYERNTLIVIADVDIGGKIHEAMTNIVHPPAPAEPGVELPADPQEPTTPANETPPPAAAPETPAPSGGDGVPAA